MDQGKLDALKFWLSVLGAHIVLVLVGGFIGYNLEYGWLLGMTLIGAGIVAYLIYRSNRSRKNDHSGDAGLAWAIVLIEAFLACVCFCGAGWVAYFIKH